MTSGRPGLEAEDAAAIAAAATTSRRKMLLAMFDSPAKHSKPNRKAKSHVPVCKKPHWACVYHREEEGRDMVQWNWLSLRF